MKQAVAALLLAGTLLLSGCSSMLDRPYVAVSPHPEHPGSGEDASSITVRNYSELVNAVLYFVSETAETGHLQLVEYDGDAESDLRTACMEVAKDAPLGAYAVESIQPAVTRVLAVYEAELSITYRRTPEQIRALVSVTGSAAIRRALGDALSSFQPEVALKVGYFTEDKGYLYDLVRQAYYRSPGSALGMPEVTISLYPDSGSQRIAELQFTYREDREALLAKSDRLNAAAANAAAPVLSQQYGPVDRLTLVLRQAEKHIRCIPAASEGPSQDTPWDALLGSGGNDEGAALALALLCRLTDVDCELVEGTLKGEPHFWNRLTSLSGAPRYVDLSRGNASRVCTGQELVQLGYLWADMETEEAAAVSGK